MMSTYAEESIASAAWKIPTPIRTYDRMDFALSALEFVSVLDAFVTKKLPNLKICIPSLEETSQESNKVVISNNYKRNLRILSNEIVDAQKSIQ